LTEIMVNGITLAGGGALLLGLDRRLQNELRIPVHRAVDPLNCVAIGTGRVAEALHLYERSGDPALGGSMTFRRRSPR
jgi:rod shape-determining protein MreB